MGAVIIGCLVALALIGGGLYALTRLGRKKNNEDTPLLQSGGTVPKLDAPGAQKIREANGSIGKSKVLASRIRDGVLKAQARETCDAAEKIVKTMRKQPDEVKRAGQFFNYYVPTMQALLEKYIDLQNSGLEVGEAREQTLSCLKDMSQAFARQYESMFKNEELDLSVEVEAMQLTLKRDGLL